MIFLGDLHGCYDEALMLLEKCQVRPGDRVIFLGDLVDRGPKPRECVELAMQHECVKGNHEEGTIKRYAWPRSPMASHHQHTIDSLDDPHLAYLRGLPLYIEVPEHNAIAVHAGLVPQVPIKDQDPHFLTHGQCLVEPKDGVWSPSAKTFWPSRATEDSVFWAFKYTGPQTVIFGHTVLSAPLVTPHAIGIDTGGVFGGQLTAYILPEKEFVSVSCPAYYPIRRKPVQLTETVQCMS